MRKFFTHTDPVVPVHHPRVLVETAVAQGATRERVLEDSGITPPMLTSAEARISYVQYGVLAKNALRSTGNPALGLDFGRNIGVAQMGVLGLALMSSATVGVALQTAIRHGRTLAPAWDMALEISGPMAIFTASETIPLAPFLVFSTEALLASIISQGNSLLGRELPIRRITIAFPEPAHAARYAAMHDGPIQFGAPATRIEFDASVLDEKIAFADPATAELAEQYCARQVVPGAPVEGLVAQMRKLLDGARGRPPNLDELARVLQTSARTLRRSLSEMRTSYQALLDESRRARAESWVRSTAMSMEEIADRLGFSDVRSFRRAFKRWTGHAPGMDRPR